MAAAAASGTSSLSVDDVSDIQVGKAMSNRAVYKDILARVHEKIVWAANRGNAEATYYIRPLQPSRPLINTASALNYVRRKLERNGFAVQHVSAAGTVLMYISWGADRHALLSRLADRCVTSNSTYF
jgi:hypothetical protein